MAPGSVLLKRGRDDVGEYAPAFGARAPGACKRRVAAPPDELLGRHIAASACAAACRAEAAHACGTTSASQQWGLEPAVEPWSAARAQLLHELRVQRQCQGPLWDCFFDLNLLCRSHSPDWNCPSLRIRSYHSMCPAAKDAIFEQFLQLYGSTLSESPETSTLLDFVHQLTLQGMARVALTTFQLPAPPFLQAWCGKYGVRGDMVMLYKVQAWQSYLDRTESPLIVYIPHLRH